MNISLNHVIKLYMYHFQIFFSKNIFHKIFLKMILSILSFLVFFGKYIL